VTGRFVGVLYVLVRAVSATLGIGRFAELRPDRKAAEARREFRRSQYQQLKELQSAIGMHHFSGKNTPYEGQRQVWQENEQTVKEVSSVGRTGPRWTLRP